MIKVVIAGPRGRMGKEAVKMVTETGHFSLVGALDHRHDGSTVGEITDTASDAPVFKDLEACFDAVKPDVLIDLTIPEVGYIHTKTALEYGVRPVVGTTGFTDAQLKELTALSEEKGLGTIIAPNFAIGAVLMMKFAQSAAKYFDDVEIIELHHDKKLDAPSGTAIKTAQLMQENRTAKKQGHPDEHETIDGARGADFNGMKIHSVRLPGLIAHQQVLFGGEGQLLTIRHDSFDRASFMSGVRVCVEQVVELSTLVYGLENILD